MIKKSVITFIFVLILIGGCGIKQNGNLNLSSIQHNKTNVALKMSGGEIFLLKTKNA